MREAQVAVGATPDGVGVGVGLAVVGPETDRAGPPAGPGCTAGTAHRGTPQSHHPTGREHIHRGQRPTRAATRETASRSRPPTKGLRPGGPIDAPRSRTGRCRAAGAAAPAARQGRPRRHATAEAVAEQRVVPPGRRDQLDLQAVLVRVVGRRAEHRRRDRHQGRRVRGRGGVVCDHVRAAPLALVQRVDRRRSSDRTARTSNPPTPRPPLVAVPCRPGSYPRRVVQRWVADTGQRSGRPAPPVAGSRWADCPGDNSEPARRRSPAGRRCPHRRLRQ